MKDTWKARLLGLVFSVAAFAFAVAPMHGRLW